MPPVACRMLRSACRMSHVACQMSHVTSHKRDICICVQHQFKPNVTEKNFHCYYNARYTTRAAIDELRLVVILTVIFTLPQYFDTAVSVEVDPCNPGQTIVVRKPNILGELL